MPTQPLQSFLVLALTILFFVSPASAQTPSGSQATTSATIQTELPFPAQLKKTVVFIQADCLHEPTPEELEKLAPAARATWSPSSLNHMKPEELRKLPTEPHSGTGFIVSVPDARLGKDHGFTYLITNRHVAQPGIETGKSCRVVGYTLLLNKKDSASGSPLRLGRIQLDTIDWHLPEDESVDLAATNFNASPNEWDIKSISTDMFTTQEMVDQGKIVEGEPVIYAGLFIQYAGQSRVQPVVRSGTVAMLPHELIPTTLGKPGRVYFADAHVFGGNSGSPLMVDSSRFTTQLGYDYRLLGVVSGEVFETKDLTLQTTTSFRISDSANSNVSMIVPAQEVSRLLNEARFVQEREVVAQAFGKKP